MLLMMMMVASTHCDKNGEISIDDEAGENRRKKKQNNNVENKRKKIHAHQLTNASNHPEKDKASEQERDTGVAWDSDASIPHHSHDTLKLLSKHPLCSRTLSSRERVLLAVTFCHSICIYDIFSMRLSTITADVKSFTWFCSIFFYFFLCHSLIPSFNPR